jgi:hypothetical protein
MKHNADIIKTTLLPLALLLLCPRGNAQVLQEVQNSFNQYKQTALQEKIFVHTDKITYLPGEIIWFKIYCVDGNDHKPLNLSKVAYVEVLDAGQAPVIQAKVALKNGIGIGSLYVPVTVNSGNYKFRAYTNWMKNFSPDFYFEKMITFINPLKSPGEPVKAHPATVYDVRFFPEGGNIIANVTNKIAFKAIGANGNGVSVKGIIIDQHKDTVTRFKSLKFGMGSFLFTPGANNTYKAVVVIDDGAPVTKSFPEIAVHGYGMMLTDNGSGSLDLVVSSGDVTTGNIYLFAHTRQTVKIAQSAVLNKGSAHFSIDKNMLGDGISHLTIFNDAKQPVCERLYFKRPQQQLLIDATADQQQYIVRKKVNINISAKDKAGRSLDADLSMAVYRVDSLQHADSSDIFSYLWLSSELKGSIESPDYYFKNPGAETDQAMDNLMLTQGWSRFQWERMLQNNSFNVTFLPEYYGHIITGKVVNSETDVPAAKVLTYLGIPGKRVQLYTAMSDSLGRVRYYPKDFYGANEIIAQTNQMIDSTYRIDIASPFSEQYSKIALPKFTVDTGMANALKAHSIGVQVLNIYSGANIKRFYDPVIDSSAFYGKPYATYKLDDYVRFTTMEEDLREYVKEDNIVKSRGRFHIKVLSDLGFLDQDDDPMALVDGIPVFDINKIFNIDPLKVRKLEVVPKIYLYGPSVETGIFSFTTYKGDLGGVELDPRAVVIDYEGLQLRREFYSPVYGTQEQSASRIPDFRNLLFWSPAVSANGTVSFYTSDAPGKYVGVVQGLTAKGDAGSRYFTFEVK